MQNLKEIPRNIFIKIEPASNPADKSKHCSPPPQSPDVKFGAPSHKMKYYIHRKRADTFHTKPNIKRQHQVDRIYMP